MLTPRGPRRKVVNSHADIVLLGTVGLQDCVAHLKTFIQQHYNPKLIIASAGPDQGQAFIHAVGAKDTRRPHSSERRLVAAIEELPERRFCAFYRAAVENWTPPTSAPIKCRHFPSGRSSIKQALAQTQSLDNQKLINVLRTGTFQPAGSGSV